MRKQISLFNDLKQGKAIVILTDQQLLKLSFNLGNILRDNGIMLATAESCTGGWVAKLVTDVPGCSQWFERGFVTYTNQSKQDMLSVPANILEQHGAVSEQTVQAMVKGAIKHSEANVSLAISGVAGPGGGSEDKPVGTVCFAWAYALRGSDPEVLSETRHFMGDRDEVRRQAVTHTMETLIERFKSNTTS